MNKERKNYRKKISAILLSTLIASSVLFSNTTVNAASGGWQQNSGRWSYVNSDGSKKTGWASIGGKWYYMDNNGNMQTGWVSIGQKWYYLNASGDMATGWRAVAGKWYYLNNNGEMLSSTLIKSNDKLYYLNTSGYMDVNTITPDGYVLGADGAWNGQVKHRDNIIYNFNMKDNKGQDYTVNILSDDNIIAQAEFNPSYGWNGVWAGAYEGERLSKGHYRITITKQGSNSYEICEVDNNSETILNLDRKLVRVHRNIENGQPDFLIMGTPACSNASEMKVYYIKNGKFTLANFSHEGKKEQSVYTFNSTSLFFKQKDNNIFETSSYDNAKRFGFYVGSYKFNLDKDEFKYIDSRFMDRDDYFNYAE